MDENIKIIDERIKAAENDSNNERDADVILSGNLEIQGTCKGNKITVNGKTYTK